MAYWDQSWSSRAERFGYQVHQVVDQVRHVALTKQYRDSPALVTMKLLDAAGVLTFDVPDA
jgi:hypothetical protein